jgi:hypothetical protein
LNIRNRFLFSILFWAETQLTPVAGPPVAWVWVPCSRAHAPLRRCRLCSPTLAPLWSRGCLTSEVPCVLSTWTGQNKVWLYPGHQILNQNQTNFISNWIVMKPLNQAWIRDEVGWRSPLSACQRISPIKALSSDPLEPENRPTASLSSHRHHRVISSFPMLNNSRRSSPELCHRRTKRERGWRTDVCHPHREPPFRDGCHHRQPELPPFWEIRPPRWAHHKPIYILPLIPSLSTHRSSELSCSDEDHGAPPWSRAEPPPARVHPPCAGHFWSMVVINWVHTPSPNLIRAIHLSINGHGLMKLMDCVSRVHGLGSRPRRPGSRLFL